MEYVEVQGASIPKIGLGTWQIGGERCREIVETALALGYRSFDTAQMYDNEAKVGAGLLAGVGQMGVDRDELWVTTKLGLENLTRDRVHKSSHESLKHLALDHIDLLLVHWPSDRVPLRETLEAMMELVDEGLVRYVGVSNFPLGMLEEALSMAPILVNQVEYHPFLAQDRMRALCEHRDVCLTAYSPLALGRVAKNDTLRTIGERYGKSGVQVALRWLTQQRTVAAIPKASSEAHLRANLDIFDFELDAEDARAVEALARGERLIDPEWAPDWNA
ncbi:MAG: aldo/keto reductase [Sandaracinaceae bacterium]|nr:aldo/keto reductase [Sandaracinaceae bacterium]